MPVRVLLVAGRDLDLHVVIHSCMSCSFTLKGGVAGKGHLRRRITVTLTVIKFSAYILAQIVETRETVLSRPVLGIWDKFLEARNAYKILISQRPNSGNLVFIITLSKVVPET